MRNSVPRRNQNISGYLISILICGLLSACDTGTVTPTKTLENLDPAESTGHFQFEAERFADMRILRYQVPGFEQLDLKTKTLLYYLSEAGMAGRDIMWDQNYRHNLSIRHLLEAVIRHYPDDRNTDEFQALQLYVKQMWFANGIHHHYSNDKFTPEFSFQQLRGMANAAAEGEDFPLTPQALEQTLTKLQPIIFDPNLDNKKVSKVADADKVLASSVNFYSGVTEHEVAQFYAEKQNPEELESVSHGLNSQLTKQNGEILERVWKVDGMYGPAIQKIVYWLEKAATVAENPEQEKALLLLAEYYRTGDLHTFDEYNIAWVKDTESTVDVINGFIEVYNDPLAYRGSFESVVSVRDPIATQRIEMLATEAQWFEDHSPIDDAHKKENVTGISAKAINVVSETGDASPATPIGINLPNSNWIRAKHGSKSVNLSNIVYAYDQVSGNANQAFSYSQDEMDRAEQYGALSSTLTTDMHEVIGHASGKLNPGVGTPKQTLKQYGSTLEEARADLVALYYIYDSKLIELGAMPNLDVGKAAYERYLRRGLLMQLQRIKPGNNIEQDHMRNRQLVARWVYEKGLSPDEQNVIDEKKKDDLTYFVINDYEQLRILFGQLLKEIQRIKSEGDFDAAQQLVETYGVKVDSELHQEVLARYEKLNIPSYSGFINPRLVAIEENGEIMDVKIEYPDDFMAQMLEYSEKHSFLPLEN